MQYNLVMKINNNNYQPFDLNLLSKYNKENLTSLEGIDKFTSKYNDELELKQDLLNANFIDIDDFNKELKIIFFENGNIREYKYSICYSEAREFLNEDRIIFFIEENLTNPLILNKIYNQFQKRKNKSVYLTIVLNILKNIKKAENKKQIYYLKYLPYEEKRSLGMYIYQNFYGIIYPERKEVDNYGQQKRIRINEPKK